MANKNFPGPNINRIIDQDPMIVKVPMATMDQRANLPSFSLILRELLDGEVAVNPDMLAAEVATLLLLRRRRDEVVELGVRRGDSLPRIAASLSGGLWPAIAAARARVAA